MATTPVSHRLKQLKAHLAQENDVLLEAIGSFRKLDKVGYALGLLPKEDSFAMQIPWWPMVSVLGTYSAGKSTFINHYIGQPVQRSGNQAVDDKFTVLCFSPETSFQALPGVALDSDPRFPFYRISAEIEKVAEGEGSRIDSYIQLKTSSSENLRGKIIIDSPGFDADKQRDSTLRITDHIIDLSDLVLVFFDARHPEPGAMRDTLDHLVSKTIERDDSSKFLYVLNQLDTAAQENNAEEVVAAWQRALGERGLTAGRFYTIYNPDVANPINDPAVRQQFERKRDADLGDIHERMNQIEIERAYRIVAALDNTSRDIDTKVVPALKQLLAKWRKRTLAMDVLGVLLILGFVLSNGWLQPLLNGGGVSLFGGGVQLGNLTAWISLALAVFLWHLLMRSLAYKSLQKPAKKLQTGLGGRLDLLTAFKKTTRWWHSIFSFSPHGWNMMNRMRIGAVREEADRYVQKLNDRYTSPSGQNMVEVQAPLNTIDDNMVEAQTAEAGSSTDSSAEKG